MTTFATRLAVAERHERDVLDALRCAGWDAEMFGQGQLTDVMRNHLRNFTVVTPLRWMPDIIAARTLSSGRSHVVFVDAKAGDKWRVTGNHDIETAALETADTWQSWTKCPVYFVFSDWSVVTGDRIWGTGRVGPHLGNGSGTPYLLFPAIACLPFAALFGDPAMTP